jgi:hypothetical protein
MHRHSYATRRAGLPGGPAQLLCALIAAIVALGVIAVPAHAQRRPFWMDPPHCTSGEQHGDNHVYVFTEGFWGPQSGPSNRHAGMACRSLKGGPRRFYNVDDNLGEMGFNTAGSFYLGEDHLVGGEISFDMRVQSDPTIADHPAGVKQRDYLFRQSVTCDECARQRVWTGGANLGGSHYFKISNGLAGKVDRLLVDFDGIEYGSIRVVVLNRADGQMLSPEPVFRYPIPELQPDSWVHFEISWMMGSSDATRGWNTLELTVNGVSHSFELLDFSCPIGRMFQLGNVDVRYWNETGTGVMEQRTCSAHRHPASLPPECKPSGEQAPFPNIQFRNLQLYLPEDRIFLPEE